MRTFTVKFEATLLSSGRLVTRRIKVRARDQWDAIDRAKLQLGAKFLDRCIYPAYRFGTQVRQARVSDAARSIAANAGAEEE